MKFWTVLQEPLCQAVLVENGKITKRIPEKAPNTPARRIVAAARYKDKLVLGRRNSLELWDFNGNKCEHIINSPVIYGLHEINQYNDDIIICCSYLDGLFQLNLDGDLKWSWFAHDNGFCPDPKLLEREDWEVVQLTEYIAPPKSCHLNSARVYGDKLLCSLLRTKKIIEVPIGQAGFKNILDLKKEGVHSPVYIKNKLCYATKDELLINNVAYKYDYRKKTNYLWVKRIVENDGMIFFTHEQGVSYYNYKTFTNIRIPRPFGVVF